MNQKDLIIDCFAGGGGASVGIEMALGRPVDIAINHDPDAILMHKTNHPNTLHLTEDIFKVNLRKYVKDQHVALMWASPDCTSHSKAKGGKPRERGLRILPWAVYKHAKEIRWPEPTHSKDGTNGKQRWVSVASVLNFSDLGQSIFGREKPLAQNTMKRTARGLEKFVFNNPEPFIVQVNHGGDNFRGQDVHEPIPTITGKHGFGMVTPYIIQYHSETAKNEVRGQNIADPLQTIDTSNRYGLVAMFLEKFYKSGVGQPMSEPMHTITTSPGHFGQVSVLAVKWEELKEAGIKPEIAQKATWVSQFIMEYYGCGTGQTTSEPLHTIVTKDRFALITILGSEYVLLDIYLRMLQPEELKLAQGFPKDYIIDKDYNWKPYPKSKQVARIGNSVVPIMAEKLVEANCPYLKVGVRVPNLNIDDSQEQLRFA